MTDEPNSVSTMRKFYNDRLHVEAQDSLMTELMGGNDRSAVITLASQAEVLVEWLIGGSLPHLQKAEEKEWNLTFRHEGPLGTFSACIDMAFYMTLINQPLRSQLHTLRDMRNAVAHTRRRVTFDDVELQNVAKRLFAPKGMFKLQNDSIDGVRRTFIAECLLINSTLIFGREVAIAMARQTFIDQGREAPF